MPVPRWAQSLLQYTAEFEAGGELGGTPAQRFLFVIEGELKLEIEGKPSKLVTGGYAYLPEGLQHRLTAAETSRVMVIEKPYQALASVEPPRALCPVKTRLLPIHLETTRICR